MLCGSLLLCEVLAYATITYGLQDVAPYLFYRRPAVASPEDIERYSEIRDPVLGWTKVDPVDADGARPSPAFPDPGNACVSVYGDSFAWSSGASSDATAWPNLLAGSLGCRVSNYGVPAYGVDQAYLRFLHNLDDKARTVLLVVFPHDVLRNLTRNFGFLSPESGMLWLKPAFRLDGAGGLELLPVPMLDDSKLHEYLRDPARYHRDDPFVWNGPEGGVELRFPYTRVVVELLWNRRLWRGVRRSLTSYPAWADFMQPGHVSGGFELALAIIGQFARVAGERGKRVMVVVLPDEGTILYYRKSGAWAYADLVGAIAASGIGVLNLGEALAQHLGPRDPAELFNPTLHYNDEGYRVLAEAVRRALAGLGSALTGRAALQGSEEASKPVAR